MKHTHRGFARIDLLAIISASVVLIAIGAPFLYGAREMSRRMVCCQNLAGLGATCKIYAGQNDGSWMVPPFKGSLIDNYGFDYTNQLTANSNTDPGAVGNNRQFESYSETPAQPSGGSSAVSVTRSYWILIRSGDAMVQQFVCPSSGDTVDQTKDVDLYYDFSNYSNISYGYQVPFGPPLTRPREGANIRQVFAADKSPFYTEGYTATWQWDGKVVTTQSPPGSWRLFNSPNHGGRGSGQGQNCLYADGHSSFQRTPAVGVDNDNIYTLIVNDQWQDPQHKNIIHGDTVWNQYNPYPGQNAFGNGANKYASTDSLIYP